MDFLLDVVDDILEKLDSGLRLAPAHTKTIHIGRMDVLDDVDPAGPDVRPQRLKTRFLLRGPMPTVVDYEVKRGL